MPSSAVHMPTFQPFILDKRRTLPDVDSISHHGNCVDVRCCGILDEADMGTTIHAYGARHQRRVGGGKRGRPVIAGRRLYGRCRKHFRFTPSNHVAPEAPDEEKQVEEPKIVCDASAATDDNAAQTSTEDDTRGVDDESVLATTSDPVKSNHNKKRSVAKELPFLSSGQEGSSTFSLVGNQQQVMKIASSKFQEWLPLIRSIIYDAGCKDYVKAFQRDLTRQKLCHAEQLRLLEV
ncbi:hypothetical protein ANCCAN_09787 [Ancylostoma caninum]|uniref:Uncharacterized protein n=1 Tax=Ancylostoma caninum TaxID=29170 RepID=A0A368GIK0_ANCCA|nr:hypothetical protein ANCCAN_09787 [Ancylostoma caninum]